MSGKASLNLKLNKKPKISMGKPKNYINREGTTPSIEKGGVTLGKSSSNSRKLKGADDGRRKRVDSHQLFSFKIDKNLESTKTKASSGKHSKMVKSDLKKGRQGNGKASPPLEYVTNTGKATSHNPKNASRSAEEEAEMVSAPNGPSKKYANSNARANSTKKIVRVKKTLKTDSEVVDDKPKKKKRIRLDPYDTSNKRLDDGTAINECKKDKKKDLEENAPMSKNAQFRGIQPSPSILSFVEDNLLGRRRTIEIQRAGYNTQLSAPLDNISFSTKPERERIDENIFRNKLQFSPPQRFHHHFPRLLFQRLHLQVGQMLGSHLYSMHLPDNGVSYGHQTNQATLKCFQFSYNYAFNFLVICLPCKGYKNCFVQSINFFELGSKLCLVDLPGYGFAYAKEEVKEAWEDLVKEYVSTRIGLKRVCLLVDTKWGMKPRDNELIDLMERHSKDCKCLRVKITFLEQHILRVIVLTKTDTVFPIDVARRAMQIEESLNANRSLVQPVMMVSSKTGAGIRSLRTVLSKIARFAKL
ncbi:P-loop containing nucleoside triphosphate hydrolases superfamily protein isoform 4 [Hibiscus syriacus]|uniref:P-loop containing nucleoside triphosphate hydrolases superfamily protein isoform 4 n=1 Tax=Hibiscus syriacus TaxID=106335 RepID=A0A6A3B6Q9_HIBSY|nr:P-loop containing nucleoside triphosphate hydrolases superfamily protein isoform 4 [Hibiscus syriacus]